MFVLGGGVRLKLSAGATLPAVDLGVSLIVIAVERDGVLYAERVRVTPPDFGGLTGAATGHGARCETLAKRAAAVGARVGNICNRRPTTACGRPY